VSNGADAKARREEEIAFLAMEQVLDVDIRLADADGGPKMPDGAWLNAEGDRRGIVEITSPPATELMRKWARAKKAGKPQEETGCIPLHLNELAVFCTELLAQEWAQENVEKLRAQPADQRHLFLYGHGQDVRDYFYRLSDSYGDGLREAVGNLVLPEGISDVWFEGRAWREGDRLACTTKVALARYNAGIGWLRYVVTIEELELPSPNPSIADDPVPSGMRHPKDRTITAHKGRA
jgi:hypothetical protein